MRRLLIAFCLPVAIVACKGKGGSGSSEMKTLADSAGYALGVDFVSNMKTQNMAGINFGLMMHSINEVLEGKTPSFTLEESAPVIQKYVLQAQANAGAPQAGTMEATIKDNKAVFATLADSVGYAMGLNIGNTLKVSNMGNINRDLMKVAISDVLKGDSLAIKPQDCPAILNNFYSKSSEAGIEINIKAGEEFLKKNAERPEVKTTPSGLQYEVITEGTGPKPTANDIFVAHYRGTLLDGTEFDGSLKRGQPLEMPVSQVVPGWIEGLQLMPKGSKYKFYLPYALGYGRQGNPPAIPGGSALIFEIELLDIKKN